MTGGHVDGLALVGLALIAFMGLNLILDYEGSSAKTLVPGEITVQIDLQSPAQGGVEDGNVENPIVAEEDAQPQPNKPNQKAFRSPYDDYTLTQGLHGQSYGHNAIDIAAGKGTKIKSPSNGEVVDLFVDQYGNTTLIWRTTAGASPCCTAITALKSAIRWRSARKWATRATTATRPTCKGIRVGTKTAGTTRI